MRGLIWLAIFVGIPVAEIWILLEVGERIGFWPTLGFVVGVGVVGAALARAEGRRVLHDLARARREGRVPEEGLVGGLLVFLGGVLLVFPGVITDVVGILLLFPPTRRLGARLVRRWIEARIAAGTIRVVRVDDRPPDDRDRDVIDVEPAPPRKGEDDEH